MAEANWTHCMYCHRLIERRLVDPNATWRMLCAYLRALNQHPDNEERRANVMWLFEALTRWLRRGGFPPTITGG
jgi:hypothetical protein